MMGASGGQLNHLSYSYNQLGYSYIYTNAWHAAVRAVTESGTTERLNNNSYKRIFLSVIKKTNNKTNVSKDVEKLVPLQVVGGYVK